jgi:putative copper resistance protein D
MSVTRQEKMWWSAGSIVFALIISIFLSAPPQTRHPVFHQRAEMDDDMADMSEIHYGAMAPEETSEQKAKQLTDKRASEFNHRFVGVLVILAALFFLVQKRLVKRWPAADYAWPMCFLAAGFFLLIFSDTEIWPMGYQSFYFAVSNDPEVAQHKLFALILLALGSVETLRISGRLNAAWSAWGFPVLAVGGVVLLLFHQHGGMHGPDAMQTMARVQSQHLTFAVVGVAVAVTKGMAESKARWREVFGKTWPFLLILLGLLLLLYAE